jgi:uncharacterized UBP type Zn finger protein
MAMTRGFCDTCGKDVMNEKCSGEHCTVCGKMIEIEGEGPVEADDSPTAEPVGAFKCPSCGEYACDGCGEKDQDGRKVCVPCNS